MRLGRIRDRLSSAPGAAPEPPTASTPATAPRTQPRGPRSGLHGGAPRREALRSRAGRGIGRVPAALTVLGAGLAASIPVIVATVKALRAGWMPAGDDGIIATRGWDVLTSHTPLVGQYSEAGLVIRGQIMHSPGPMLYWLIALPARFGSVGSITGTICAANTLAIIGCVALARRRGGWPLMLACAAGIALMCQSLPSESLHDIWNPAAALFPFLLLIFIGWSLACGDVRLLPLAALVGSFVVQTHLAYLAGSAVVLAVGLAGLALSRMPWRGLSVRLPFARRSSSAAGERDTGAHRRPAPPRGEPRGRRPRLWPWALAALAVLACCWAAPVVQQVSEQPGNLTLIERTVEHRGPTVGARAGWTALVRAIGQRPWWLYVPPSEWERKRNVFAPLSVLREDSAVAVLAALALICVAGLAARRPDLLAAALIALGLCAAIVAQVAANPSSQLLRETLGYTLWWGSELGFWVWLVLAWALWLGLSGLARRAMAALAPRRRARAVSWGRARAAGLLSALLLGVAGVGAVGDAVARTERPDSHVYEYAGIAALARGVERVVPAHRTIDYRLGPLDRGTQPMEPALRFLLVRHDDRVLAEGSYPRLGSWYTLGHRRYQWIVYLADGSRPVRGMRLAARARFRGPWGPEVISAWVAPARRATAQRRVLARRQASRHATR